MTKIENLPLASDLMTSNPQTIAAEMTLDEVVQFLLKHRLSNAPVVRHDSSGQPILVGFLSEGDCLEHMSNEMFYGNPSPRQTAQTMMKKHPVCVAPDTDVFTIASVFISHRVRHLPVTKSEKLVGIVSRFDVLKSLERYYDEWTRTHDGERSPIDIHEIMNHRFIAAR